MKAVVLLSALVFSSVLLAAAQQKEKKDDAYPVALSGNPEQFAPPENVDSDVETGFKIENYELVWQKVFDVRIQPEHIERYFKRSGIFKQIETDSNAFSGFLSYFNAKGAELSTILTPYTRNTLFSAFAVVELKGGKYRVTIKKIMIMNYYADQNVKFSYDDLVFKSNLYEMKPSFLKKEAKIMDEVLTRMFSVNVARPDSW